MPRSTGTTLLRSLALAILLSHLLDFDDNGSVLKVDILNPYADQFTDSNADPPWDADKQSIPGVGGSSNEPLQLRGFQVSTQVSDWTNRCHFISFILALSSLFLITFAPGSPFTKDLVCERLSSALSC